TIRNDGNVGIGTMGSGQKLDIAGNIQMSGVRTKLFYRGDSDSHIGSLAFYSPDGGVTAIITPYNSTGGNIANSTIRFGGFGSFESNTVNFTVSGNVGIGMTTPQVPGLHIGSGVLGGQPQIQLDHNNGNKGQINRWSDRLEISSTNSIALAVGGIVGNELR